MQCQLSITHMFCVCLPGHSCFFFWWTTVEGSFIHKKSNEGVAKMQMQRENHAQQSTKSGTQTDNSKTVILKDQDIQHIKAASAASTQRS